MNKSKLAVVFDALTHAERRDLGKFLHSPYFNQRQDVLALYAFLEGKRREGQAKLEKTDAWKHVYPDAPYDDTKMRHCMSFLYKLIEQYLVEKAKPTSEAEQKIHLAQAYRERNLQRHFEHAMQAANRFLEQHPKDQQYYYLKHLYEMEQYNQAGATKRSTAINLQSLGNAYDVQFLANKLKQSCLQLSHQAVLKWIMMMAFCPLFLGF